MFKEPARNSFCPCESGKKFKKCCAVNLNVKIAVSKVTASPVLNIQESLITHEDKDKFNRISVEINEGGKNFKSYLQDLLLLKEHNPKERRIYNLIGVCYNQLGKNQEAIEVIKETCNVFPDYLFGKTGLMRSFFYENNHQKYLEIFGKVFDLHTLYPEREMFHISEALDFYNVAGTYLAREKKFYLSRQCLKILFNLSPEHELVHQLNDELIRQLAD
jgi:tetratricopeptide (TPR) repeat protein